MYLRKESKLFHYSGTWVVRGQRIHDCPPSWMSILSQSCPVLHTYIRSYIGYYERSEKLAEMLTTLTFPNTVAAHRILENFTMTEIWLL